MELEINEDDRAAGSAGQVHPGNFTIINQTRDLMTVLDIRVSPNWSSNDIAESDGGGNFPTCDGDFAADDAKGCD